MMKKFQVINTKISSPDCAEMRRNKISQKCESKQKLTRKRIEIRNFKISNMKKLQKQGISRLPT